MRDFSRKKTGVPIDSRYLAPFTSGDFYHIYNRSPSKRKMFLEESNYFLFLNLLKKYLLFYIDIYSYSLIPNHFHLFIRVKHAGEDSGTGMNKTITNQFRKVFISYTNTLNKEYTLQGGFFSTPFKRILITNEAYFSQIIYYIHCNAIHHNLCTHPSEYLFSSYNSILSNKPSLLKRDEVLAWFGGKEAFIQAHELMKSYYTDDFFP